MLAQPLIDQVVLLSFVGLLVFAAVEDMRRLTIPNRICLAIALLYPAHVLASPMPVDFAVAAAFAAGALVVGFILFSRGFAGGGDVKLFAAVTLWAAPALFQRFLLITALTGASIAIGMLVHRRLTRASAGAGAGHADPPVKRAPVLPYGVAIAVGGVQVAVILFMGA